MNPTSLKKLAWARSQRFVRNSINFSELRSHHLVTRYFSLLEKEVTTEDVDFLLDRAALLTYAASKDFEIDNIVGYFLAVFDNLSATFSINPEKLKVKMKQGAIEWNHIPQEVYKSLHSKSSGKP